MTVTFITPEDLSVFKIELLKEIKGLFSDQKAAPKIELMRTKEVLNFLKCSESTLDKLKKTGKLPFTRVMRTIYYKRSDVEALINEGI